MELTTNGVVITDAIKYVTQKTEQLDTLQKIDERIEEAARTEEDQTTTNGVFQIDDIINKANTNIDHARCSD
jgi:hypothetical protein